MISELNDSLRGKMRILEDLNFTTEEKRKIKENKLMVNQKLEYTIKKMEDEKKKI